MALYSHGPVQLWPRADRPGRVQLDSYGLDSYSNRLYSDGLCSHGLELTPLAARNGASYT